MGREYGLCLWTFGSIPFEQKCRLAAEIGVDGVEVEGDLSVNPKDLAKTLDAHQVKVLSVTPRNVDISSANEEVCSKAVQYFLDLLDWAVDLGAPRICLHGDVGKVRGSGDHARDWSLLVKSAKKIMAKAEKLQIQVVFEVLNRYENHQVVTCEEALQFIRDVGSSKLEVLLDAYHMNIEEADPVKAIELAGQKLGVYHVADSNRQAIGSGHANLKEQIEALHSIGYSGPIIMEMVAAGPDPFTPVKEDSYLEVVTGYFKSSLETLRSWEGLKI
ncbi:sugar phosphate isomerase/epimerase family protein [Bacillus cabrialesii subsp. cabrialesii]|uniref:sugar phosphate isomerase/epimerase family protein n=1 Tax=Bacillus cabrialesii TaxID=2487276 RepID=UPI0033065291